ncbi:hypothetical protein FAZ69_16860 [Trinickia terrae]|uniref:Uncharacterized protein n=1 Tax=Trinickia terrae TaxID=2571161 RepID=A0A4U1I3V1_9BURK|nr:hypothetical protein [Trinickia terrae]TKC87929.1 hypothetical protein FAZ69_16860 [Trinickia terrae]
MARIVEAGLLFPLDHDRYRFRHQALRRAALERLPVAERRALHAHAAEGQAAPSPRRAAMTFGSPSRS